MSTKLRMKLASIHTESITGGVGIDQISHMLAFEPTTGGSIVNVMTTLRGPSAKLQLHLSGDDALAAFKVGEWYLIDMPTAEAAK